MHRVRRPSAAQQGTLRKGGFKAASEASCQVPRTFGVGTRAGSFGSEPDAPPRQPSFFFLI